MNYMNEYHFGNVSQTAEDLKKEKFSSEEAYLMLESRIVDLFKEKVFLRKIFIPSEMSYFKSIGKINFLGES